MKRAVSLGVVGFCLALLPLAAQEKAPDFNEVFKKAYGDAVDAFNRNDFETSMAKLDEAEKAQPGISQTLNLRGALYVRTKKLDEASAAFRKLIEMDPKDPIPVFNLGEVYFLQKNYVEGKKMFQKFLEMPDNAQNALGRYKVFLCDVMLGNTADVAKTIQDLRPNTSNPFYYFANAAVAFKKGDAEEGRSFAQSAFSIYGGGINAAFADSFIELGWLNQDEIGQVGAVDATALKSLSQEARPGGPTDAEVLSNTLDTMLPGLEPEKDKNKNKEKEKKQ